MITGAVEEAVVGYAFLVAMGRVDGTIFWGWSSSSNDGRAPCRSTCLINQS